MKILWLTHLLLPEFALALGRAASPRGGWVPTLARELVDTMNVELAVVTPLNIASTQYKYINGIHYYAVPASKESLDKNRLDNALISNYQNIANNFYPNVVHVHGTEYFEGLITGGGYLVFPTVVSIQGIIEACKEHYYGGISIAQILASRTLRDWLRCDGLVEQKLKWERRTLQERAIFSSNAAFIGRTLWDRAHVRRLNPGARYYHCDEMLRATFYQGMRDYNEVVPYSIFASSAGYPLKGFHVLVKAVALLKDEFPKVRIRTPLAKFINRETGYKKSIKNLRMGGYARYLGKLITKHGVAQNVFPLPTLSEEGMAMEYRRAHVFVLPSLIENSPNSLAEAMMLGTPTISSYVGGVPSMARDEESVLFFPPGDEVVLAEQIRRVFLSRDLAEGLSSCAYERSIVRHNKAKIVKDILEIYREEISILS